MSEPPIWWSNWGHYIIPLWLEPTERKTVRWWLSPGTLMMWLVAIWYIGRN